MYILHWTKYKLHQIVTFWITSHMKRLLTISHNRKINSDKNFCKK